MELNYYTRPILATVAYECFYLSLETSTRNNTTSYFAKSKALDKFPKPGKGRILYSSNAGPWAKILVRFLKEQFDTPTITTQEYVHEVHRIWSNTLYGRQNARILEKYGLDNVSVMLTGIRYLLKLSNTPYERNPLILTEAVQFSGDALQREKAWVLCRLWHRHFYSGTYIPDDLIYAVKNTGNFEFEADVKMYATSEVKALKKFSIDPPVDQFFEYLLRLNRYSLNQKHTELPCQQKAQLYHEHPFNLERFVGHALLAASIELAEIQGMVNVKDSPAYLTDNLFSRLRQYTSIQTILMDILTR